MSLIIGAESAGTDIAVGVAVLVVASIVSIGIAVGLGFACRSILVSKGRSGGAGFCLGFFLGLIGLVVALCLSDQRRASPHVLSGPTSYNQPYPQGNAGQRPGWPTFEEAAPTTAPNGAIAVGAPILGIVGAGLSIGALADSSQLADELVVWVTALLVVIAAIATLASRAHWFTVGALAGTSAGLGAVMTWLLGHRWITESFYLEFVRLRIASGAALALAAVLILAAYRDRTRRRDYPVVSTIAVLVYGALSAKQSFDDALQLGWVVSTAVVGIAFFVRGRAGVIAALAAALVVLGNVVERHVRYSDVTPYDWIAVTVLVVAAVGMLVMLQSSSSATNGGSGQRPTTRQRLTYSDEMRRPAMPTVPVAPAAWPPPPPPPPRR